jgi:hypothetical protein
MIASTSPAFTAAPFSHQNLLDGSFLWRLDLVLHLHRFHHRHTRALFHLISVRARASRTTLPGIGATIFFGPCSSPGPRAAAQ